MKANIILISFLFLLSCCIGTDIIDDYVKPTLKIDASTNISSLKVGESHQFKSEYTNNVGEKSLANVTWKSDNPTVISITEKGKATAHKKGVATLTATASDASISIKVEAADKTKVVEEVNERTAKIKTTSTYNLSGTAILKKNNNKLTLTLSKDFMAGSGLPDLRLYLSNSTSSILTAKEVSLITQLTGEQSFEIEGVKITDFRYVFFHCTRFGVPVGNGELKP